jgi:hypothetical protein
MLKLSDFETTTIQELHLLSGLSESVIQEVLEYVFIRQMEQLLEGAVISIPFIGKLTISYDGDDYIGGTKVAKLSTELTASGLLKRVVGEIQDDDSDILSQLMQRKIKSAVQDILNGDVKKKEIL